MVNTKTLIFIKTLKKVGEYHFILPYTQNWVDIYSLKENWADSIFKHLVSISLIYSWYTQNLELWK